LQNKTQGMIRTKDQSLHRGEAPRQNTFAFRRIQARELYQPAQEMEGHPRLRFRIRLRQLGQGEG